MKKKLKILRKYIDDNFAKKRIWHLIINVKTFVLFVFKNNEKFHLCVNYKNFNVITITIFFSIDIFFLNRLIDVKYFTKLNFKNVYYRIKIKKIHKWKIAFRTRYELFKYAIMSFDLINVLTIFQIFINKTFQRLINHICVIFLNDIFIYFKTKKTLTFC